MPKGYMRSLSMYVMRQKVVNQVPRFVRLLMKCTISSSYWHLQRKVSAPENEVYKCQIPQRLHRNFAAEPVIDDLLKRGSGMLIFPANSSKDG
jgi:hypothetical protein